MSEGPLPRPWEVWHARFDFDDGGELASVHSVLPRWLAPRGARTPLRAALDKLTCATEPTKLRGELGWRPAHTDFWRGLEQTIRWYEENEVWWRPAKVATEARYRAQGQ